MARLALDGIPLAQIAMMPFRLIQAMAEESRRREERLNSGMPGWDPDAIPEPEDPDGPPNKALFVAYAMVAGSWNRKRAEAEYERQVARGGHDDPDLISMREFSGEGGEQFGTERPRPEARRAQPAAGSAHQHLRPGQ